MSHSLLSTTECCHRHHLQRYSPPDERAALFQEQAAERHQREAAAQRRAQERRAAAVESKRRAAQLLDDRRAARHALEAAADAERARAWRARRLAAVVRAVTVLGAGLAAARRLHEARVHSQEAEAAAVVIQKCYRVSSACARHWKDTLAAIFMLPCLLIHQHITQTMQAHLQRRQFLRQKRAATLLQRAYRRRLAGGLEGRRRATAAILLHFLCESRGMPMLRVAVRRLQRTGGLD